MNRGPAGPHEYSGVGFLRQGPGLVTAPWQHALHQIAALAPGGEQDGQQVQRYHALQGPGTPDVPVVRSQLEPHLGILEPAGTGGGQDQQPERPDRQLAAAVVTGGRWRALAQLHRLLAKIFPAWDEGSQPGMALGKREPPRQAQADQGDGQVTQPLVPLLASLVEPEVADTDGRHTPVGEADQTIPVEGISLFAWHICDTPSSGR